MADTSFVFPLASYVEENGAFDKEGTPLSLNEKRYTVSIRFGFSTFFCDLSEAQQTYLLRFG